MTTQIDLPPEELAAAIKLWREVKAMPLGVFVAGDITALPTRIPAMVNIIQPGGTDDESVIVATNSEARQIALWILATELAKESEQPNA